MKRFSYADVEVLVKKLKGVGLDIKLQYGNGIYAANSCKFQESFNNGGELYSFLRGLATAFDCLY